MAPIWGVTPKFIQHSPNVNKKPCRRCGKNRLYWGHSPNGNQHGKYCAEHNSRNWTLIEEDGTKHVCVIGADDMPPVSSDGDIPQLVKDPWTGEEVPPPSHFEGIIRDLEERIEGLQIILDSKVDLTFVRNLVKDAIADRSEPVQVVIRNKETKQAKVLDGLTHKMFPMVLRRLARGRNVLMVGPAGTGKSKIARQAAEALDIAYYDISLNPGMTATAILGYMDAGGVYHGTPFRQAWEHGGVFHFDEFDNGHPSILALANAALAGAPTIAFPDAVDGVKRHSDFRCCASANTYGRGPDRAYVGRQALDLATLDRFSVITVDVDEALEEALCVATGLNRSTVKQVLAYVRHLRRKADDNRMPLGFGPRRSEGLCDALADGIAVQEAIDMEVRRGISDTDWKKVSAGAPVVGGNSKAQEPEGDDENDWVSRLEASAIHNPYSQYHTPPNSLLAALAASWEDNQ